jgi:sigma-B regulation protein RsbU (phosphoserine phosphatase)
VTLGRSDSSTFDTAPFRRRTPTPLARVLVADDQPDVLVALSLLLKGEGFEVETVDSPAAALGAASGGRFDLVLMDLNYTRDTTSGAEGLELLARLRERREGPEVVVMTAWGTIDLAVEAMRLGARGFVLKPWDNQALVRTLRERVEERDHRRERALAERGAADRELDLARRVQRQLLPRTQPRLATLEYTGDCREAGAVGGDGYDFLDLGPGALGLMLTDTSGKGMGAALLMANLQATLRAEFAAGGLDLPRRLEAVNALFLASTAPEHYATLFFGCYDDARRRLVYANCGHNPPLVLRADGSCERLPATAPVLGLMGDWTCEEREIDIARGDTLVVFSDGVTEARNAREEEFGEARLVDVVLNARARPLASLPAAILAAVEGFAGTPPGDDLTLVAARGR